MINFIKACLLLALMVLHGSVHAASFPNSGDLCYFAAAVWDFTNLHGSFPDYYYLYQYGLDKCTVSNTTVRFSGDGLQKDVTVNFETGLTSCDFEIESHGPYFETLTGKVSCPPGDGVRTWSLTPMSEIVPDGTPNCEWEELYYYAWSCGPY